MTSNVLPQVCIICEKHRKRQKHGRNEPLHSAETISCGKLLEAAKGMEDNRLITLLGNQDCVALEVKYHNSCRSRYVLSYKNMIQSINKEYTEDPYWKKFCEEVIERRIITSNEKLSLTQLLKLYDRLHGTSSKLSIIKTTIHIW